MKWARVLVIAAALVMRPSPASAQLEAFVQTVRDVVEASAKGEPSKSTAIRAAAARMIAALLEWDRTLGALEARTRRELPTASNRRAYELHVELGVAYRTRGRLADALRELDAAARLRPSASDLQVLRALTLETAGRPADAAKAFRAAWTIDAPNPVKAYYVMARAGGAASPAERGRVASVLKEEYRRLALDSTRPPAAPFVTLGAIPDALSRTPVIADAATAGAFAFFGANMYGLGAAALTRVAPLAEQADSPLAHFARGQRLERENQVAEARAAYETALTGALVGRSALLVGIARLAQVEGDLPSAINAFTEAVRLNPNDPGIHKELSGVYAAAGSTDQAFGELLAALLVNPRDTEAHAAIGQLYLDTSRQAEAVPAFTRALELAPDRYEIRYALARALARTGNQAEAERQLDLFERARRAALDQRRRDIAHEVEQEQRQR